MSATIFLWDNLGPPHYDRLESAQMYFGPDRKVIGAEIFGDSNEYDWKKGAGDSARVVTLFEERSAFGTLSFLKKLAGLVRRAKARHVFVCNYDRGYILLAAALLRLMGRRVYLMIDSKFDDKPRQLSREILKAIYLLPYNGVLAASDRSQDYLRFLGFRSEQIRAGYDTIDVARLRAQCSFSVPAFAERPFVIVARLVAKKNIHTALRAFALAFRQTRERRLKICGSGPLLEELKALAAELGIADLVEFTGFLQTEAISDAVGQSLALVLPSTEEQFGQVVAEAVALSIPVMVSLACGARDELVRNGVNGFIFEPTNVEGLAYLMKLIARDELLWREMAENSKSFLPLADSARFAEAAAKFVQME
ncbi:glycosyltransferase [Rhizobium sp. BK251]|uniref:glycosyltransferase n=1 Tax=Rhizobium sp. BK251 TaxID=2512125 RepID=UPI001044E1D0|nr:glycosyltransferase [Rhizobium sp. BK251]TCL72984.1 glycosyl transferase family 1 [Rhizobium sp. BK251]